MIPEDICQRFKIQKVYAVSRGDYMMAYGRPCQVDKLVFMDGVLTIACHDVFTHIGLCVQTRCLEPFFKYTFERVEHTVLHSDDEGVLTDTEDPVFATTHLDVTPGSVIHTCAAPICGAGTWRVVRGVEKIT